MGANELLGGPDEAGAGLSYCTRPPTEGELMDVSPTVEEAVCCGGGEYGMGSARSGSWWCVC